MASVRGAKDGIDAYLRSATEFSGGPAKSGTSGTFRKILGAKHLRLCDPGSLRGSAEIVIRAGMVEFLALEACQQVDATEAAQAETLGTNETGLEDT